MKGAFSVLVFGNAKTDLPVERKPSETDMTRKPQSFRQKTGTAKSPLCHGVQPKKWERARTCAD